MASEGRTQCDYRDAPEGNDHPHNARSSHGKEEVPEPPDDKGEWEKGHGRERGHHMLNGRTYSR